MHKAMFAVIISILFVGCGSSALISEGENGLYESSFAHHEKEYALKEATDGAKEHCKGQKQRAIIVDKKINFDGKLLDEKSNAAVKAASNVAWMLKGSKASNALDSVAQESKYEVDLTFRCQ